VKFEETADPSGKKLAKRGAIAGGLIGLIFPPSIIAGAAVGDHRPGPRDEPEAEESCEATHEGSDGTEAKEEKA
jgi:hypothetical protein